MSERLREQMAREQARRQLVMDSLRAHLAEQPSPRAVRTCARRWSTDITHLAETVITERQNQETAA